MNIGNNMNEKTCSNCRNVHTENESNNYWVEAIDQNGLEKCIRTNLPYNQLVEHFKKTGLSFK